VISEIYLVILSIYVYGTGLSTIKSPKTNASGFFLLAFGRIISTSTYFYIA